MKQNSSKSQLINNRSKYAQEEKEDNLTGVPKKQRSVNKIKQQKPKNGSQLNEGKEFDTNIVKWRQLFSIIDTFYSTLCNLPLQKLISSSQPQVWLHQQQETLEQLQKKLDKAIKSKDYEYYRWKLESVAKILDNIKDNMKMLTRITHLKNYYSGTDTSNYRSRGSSSLQSELHQSSKIGQLSNDSCEQMEMLSYDRYIIKPNSKIASQTIKNRSPEIMAETVQSDEEDSESEPVMARSQMFKKKQTTKRQRNVSKEGENRNSINMQKKATNISEDSKMKNNDMKDKTLAKIPNSKAMYSQRTVSNFTGDGRFLQDRILDETNPQTQFNTCFENKSQTIASKEELSKNNSESAVNQLNIQDYLEMIKQMRLQLMYKDQQIEKLLINQQEYQEGLELFREREKQKNTEILFLKENISNSNKEKQKLILQIKKILEIQQELRETIRFERNRNKREERQKEKIQEKYQQESSSRDQLMDQINRLKDENKNCRKNQRVMKQKLQVYTKKYFSIYRQLQQSKQSEQLLLSELRQTQRNKSKSINHYEQIKSIIEYHKQKIAEDSIL